MKKSLLAILIYFLLSNKGSIFGPFPSYEACSKYLEDHGSIGQCVPQ